MARTCLSEINRSKNVGAVRCRSAAIFLVQVLSNPGEERIELVRIDQEINYERDRSQHEYRVSHATSPR